MMAVTLQPFLFARSRVFGDRGQRCDHSEAFSCQHLQHSIQDSIDAWILHRKLTARGARMIPTCFTLCSLCRMVFRQGGRTHGMGDLVVDICV